jgi:hypothetical protein
MKKAFLGAFIFVDIGLIGGSAFVLFTTISQKMSVHSVSFPSAPSSAANSAPASTGKAVGGGISAPAASADSSTRNIKFSYRSPHAKQVSIRADFTGWKAEPMQKGANGTWTYQAALTPGEYAYCYTADDKTFKDPANKRTKQIGRTLVSAIVVEPRSSNPPK